MIDWHEWFKYHHDGTLSWRKTTNRRIRVGSIAGCVVEVSPDYFRVEVALLATSYKAHRIVWEMHHGLIPDGLCIDHVNGTATDNRIENLRLATRTENQQNQRKVHRNNKSGYLGVHFCSTKQKYLAKIKDAGKFITIGAFDDPAVAHQAYLETKRKLHGFCTI